MQAAERARIFEALRRLGFATLISADGGGVHLSSPKETPMTVPRLYDYTASANCYKVRLCWRSSGREYERINVDISLEHAHDDYERLNPFRSTPVLQLAAGER